MNYKTTLMIAGIAAAAFMAIGSVTPVFESAFAQDNNVVGNCNQADVNGTQNCRNNQGGQAGGQDNTQNNTAGNFS